MYECLAHAVREGKRDTSYNSTLLQPISCKSYNAAAVGLTLHVKFNDLHYEHEPQAQRRKQRQQLEDPTTRDKSKAGKARNDLAFVECLLSTGATDESEVNWSSLSSTYPRAYFMWKCLRGGRMKQSPYSHLGFREVRRRHGVLSFGTLSSLGWCMGCSFLFRA